MIEGLLLSTCDAEAGCEFIWGLNCEGDPENPFIEVLKLLLLYDTGGCCPWAWSSASDISASTSIEGLACWKDDGGGLVFTGGDIAKLLPNELFVEAPLEGVNENCEAVGAGVGSVDSLKDCTFLPPAIAGDAAVFDCVLAPNWNPDLDGAAVFECVLVPNWNPDVDGAAVFGCVLAPNWKPDIEGAAVFGCVLEPNWNPDVNGAVVFDCVLEPNWKLDIEGTVVFCWLFVPFKIFGSMLFKKPELCGGCCFVGEVCLGLCERGPFDLACIILLHPSASARKSLSA